MIYDKLKFTNMLSFKIIFRFLTLVLMQNICNQQALETFVASLLSEQLHAYEETAFPVFLSLLVLQDLVREQVVRVISLTCKLESYLG
jgi:hypothetical protein